jgi:DNA-binding helix-hairpin-helix protein with protein kinase domain
MLYAGSTPVGFTMPLVPARRPLHELLGPRSRHELFPNAHWSFLIHTARNLARAFAVLHERNVVIGDVNSNNIVVCADSTARLIDCDSFAVDSLKPASRAFPGRRTARRYGCGQSQTRPARRER